MLRKMIFCIRHMFDRFVIKKYNGKYIVIERFSLDFFQRAIHRSGLFTETQNKYFYDDCTVDTCEQAHEIMQTYKQILVDRKIQEKEEKMLSKTKTAYECYKDY